MAEPIGLALGVAGLGGIFTSCVNCFEYVQIGRQFGKDYGRYMLRVDVVRLRLSRWGESVGMYMAPAQSPTEYCGSASSEDIAKVNEILGEIMELFADVEKSSNKFKLKAKPEETTV